MSLIARLTELRAMRAACALVTVQQAIERLLRAEICPEEQLEKLCILRELVIGQLEQLSPRIRRCPPLRTAIDAACRAYRTWLRLDSGIDVVKHRADELSMRVKELGELVRGTEQPPREDAVFLTATR
jgi:hypothetical protein